MPRTNRASVPSGGTWTITPGVLYSRIVTQFIGFMAAAIGALAFVPQVVKTWRTRSSGDLSAGMLAAMTTAAALWVFYGIQIGSPPVIAGNVVTLMLAAALAGLKIRREAGHPSAGPSPGSGLHR